MREVKPEDTLVIGNQANARIMANNIAKQPYPERLAYTYEHLSTLAKGVAKLSRHGNFKKMLYEKAEKKQLKEEVVLFQTLIEEGKKRSIAVMDSMQSATNINEVNEALTAFSGIEGINYFPQVYIPFYEQLKKKQHDKMKIDPVIVVYAGDETKQVYSGYKLDNKGQLVETDLIVDENYAKLNEVWVVSLNESYTSPSSPIINESNEAKRNNSYISGPITNDIDPDPCPGGDPNCGGNGGGGDTFFPPYLTCADDGNTSRPNLTQNGIDIYIPKMQVSCHKESFAGGMSELSFVVATGWNTGYNPYTGSAQADSN